MTMRLWFNVPSLKCIKHDDSGPHSEFYFTYQAYFDLDDHQRSLTQGFSLGCPLDDGYALANDETRTLNDPKVLFEVPELTVGQSNIITLDLFLWESDHSTVETKKVFTNAAASKLWEIYQAAAQKKQKTRDEFLTWLKGEGLNLVEGAATALGASAAVGATMITVSKALIPFISWAIELAKTNSDDFIGMVRLQLQYKRTDKGYRYRWILNDGAPVAWTPEEEHPVDLTVNLKEADGGNHVSAHLLLQLLFDAEPVTPEAAAARRLALPIE